MKKILVTLLLFSFALTANAQKTYSIESQLKLKTVPAGSPTDSIVSVNSSGLIRYIPKSSITVDGSETKVTAGTNTTITGTGTVASPYVINASGGGSTPDASATVTGSVNNTSLQELGGVDKSINGLRIGRGSGNFISNIVIGTNALNVNSADSYNTAIGYEVLMSNTTGLVNTGIGNSALRLNTTGNSNNAIGVSALSKNTTGNSNVAIGNNALSNAITAIENTCIGNSAGFYLTGSGNTGIGNFALNTISGTNTGIDNIAIGNRSGRALKSGSGNIIIESQTTNTTTGRVSTGSNNVIIRQSGTASGSGVETGSNNIIIGAVTGLSASLANNIVLSDGVGNIRAQHNGTDWKFSGQLNKTALDTAPATATSTGTLGEVRFTATGVFICTATNTWIQCAGVTF